MYVLVVPKKHIPSFHPPFGSLDEEGEEDVEPCLIIHTISCNFGTSAVILMGVVTLSSSN